MKRRRIYVDNKTGCEVSDDEVRARLTALCEMTSQNQVASAYGYSASSISRALNSARRVPAGLLVHLGVHSQVVIEELEEAV